MTGLTRPPVPDSHRQGAIPPAHTTGAGHYPRLAPVVDLAAFRRRKHLRLAWTAPEGPMAA